MTDHAAYRSTQWLTALWLLLPLVLAFFVAEQRASHTSVVPLVIAAATFATLLLLLGRLVIEVGARELRWRFGFVGWPRWRVAFDDIATLERVKALPYGAGAGIRGTRRDRQYIARLGGQALRLVLRDGRIVTLGTAEPERLAAFIEARRRR